MRASFVTAIVVWLVSVSFTPAQQQAQPPPTFRTRVSVVPVDVRVVDRDGKPITDLRQSDFTVLEDGVPQKIVHFSLQVLQAVGGPVEDKPLEFRKPLGESVTPQNKRIFLIVLGRGRQVGPVKGVEGALRFIKDGLLPQDQVAILGYNRATDFTTDHKRVLETLDRYWKKHESIEARLRQRFSGLAAVYGGTDIPPGIQKDIDGIFRAPGALTSRSVDSTGIPDAAQIARDNRRDRDRIQNAELAREKIAAGVGSPFDQHAIEEASMLPDTFDQYVEKSFDTQTDLGNLYAGIRYLRLLDGEKHLVFITPNGLFLPRLENANSLAALANDARVTVDVIHTYGTAPAQLLGARGTVVMAPAFGQVFQNASSREIATLTGGQMTSSRTGDWFFKRLDDSTRAQYLIGYSPSNTTWDGKYRKIQVHVNRPGAQALYRHGYLGRRETTPIDREQYLMYTRITSAANLPRVIDDVKLEVGEPSISDDRAVLTVAVRVMPGTVRLKLVDGLYVGKLEAVSFCGDRSSRLVGELWHTVELKLPETVYQGFLRDGAVFNLRMPLRGEPRFIKTIVYDYNADLVGSALVQLKK